MSVLGAGHAPFGGGKFGLLLTQLSGNSPNSSTHSLVQLTVFDSCACFLGVLCMRAFVRLASLHGYHAYSVRGVTGALQGNHRQKERDTFFLFQ